MQLPGEKTWTQAFVWVKEVPVVTKSKVGDQEYRRNRRQLIQTNEPPPLPDIQTTPNGSRSFETTLETNRGDTLETTPTQEEKNSKKFHLHQGNHVGQVEFGKNQTGLVNVQKIVELDSLN